MANLGELYFSLDIKSKIDDKIKSYSDGIKTFTEKVSDLQDKINALSAEMNKLDKGGGIWTEKRKEMVSYFQEIDENVKKIQRYEKGLARYNGVKKRLDDGGLLIPARRFVSLQDTKPLEEQINKYERIIALQKEIANVQGRIADVRKRTVGRIGGFGVENYVETTSRLRSRLASLTEELNGLGGGSVTLDHARAQLDSLYSVLEQYDKANRQVRDSTASARGEEQRRARAVKDARIAFEPLVSAMAREEAQERANKANIEATNRARQKSVQALREQSEAMVRNRIAELQNQRASLARLYSQGRSIGLDPAELETILGRYREISRELLNLRTMMQNPGGLSYNEMFSMGRVVGPGANYVKEAASQVSALRARTQEAAASARDLASAFSRAYGAAERTSSALSDIKSLFLQGGIVFGAQQFANSIVQTGGDIVRQHMALRSILGDIKDADTLFAQTQQLALQSPFTFQELNRDVKQLAAFGVESDNLYETTRRLADIASGLGVSFERLGLAYGQVKARSWLDGKELRQFAYAGLPLLKRITDLYNETGKNGRTGYTESEVKTMISKRQVSFEDVDKVLRQMTDEGGQFYNMQFVLSETLLGRWNKLIDAWDIMLGKFADGDNVLGRTFMNAINAATEFVLALDRIAPALMGAAAVFSGKAVLGGLMAKGGLGIGRVQRVMSAVTNEQMRQYGLSMMQQVAEGKVSAEKARQLVLEKQKMMSSASVRDLTYAQLFSEGRISAMQLAQLLRRKQVSAELIKQMRIMGLLTAEQEKLILGVQRERSLRSQAAGMMRLGAGSAGSALGGLFTVGNVVTAAAAVAAAIGFAYKQWSDNIDSMTENAAASMRQKAERIRDALKQAAEAGKTKESVRQMEELVEQSGYYTQSIKDQVEQATTLGERYDALYGILEKIRDINEAGAAHDYSGVIKASAGNDLGSMFNPFSREFWTKPGNWIGRTLPYTNLQPWTHSGLSDFLFNDDITKNLEQYSESINQFGFVSDNMKAYSDDIDKAIEGIRGEYQDLYDEVKGKPLEEQLRILSQSDAWDALTDRVSESHREFASIAGKFKGSSENVADKWDEIVSDDIPKMAKALAKENGYTLDEFKTFCHDYQDAGDKMLVNLVNSMNITSEEIRNKLLNALREAMGISERSVAQPAPKEPTAYDKQTHVGKVIMRNIVNRNGNGVITTADLNELTGTENFADAAKSIKSEYDDRKKEYDAAVKAQANAADLEEKKRKLDQITKVAEAAGVDTEDKKAESGKSKEDAARRKADQATLKALQARLDLVKDAYSMYRKYYGELHNEEGAAKEVSERFRGKGLSKEDVANITSEAGYKGLVEDYLRRVANTAFLMPEEMNERKDSLISAGIKELNDIDFNMLSDAIKETSETTERSLSRMSKAWKTFRTVLEGTGDAALAGRLSGSKGGDLYSQLLKAFLRGNFSNVVVPTNLAKMSDKDIEGFAGGQSIAPASIASLVSVLKELRDTMEKEAEEAAGKAVSLYKEDVTETARKNRITQTAADRDAAISTLESAGLISNKDKTRLSGMSSAIENYDLIKASDDYAALMRNAVTITKETARSLSDSIVSALGEKMKAGVITAEEFAKELEELDERLLDVKTRLSDTQTFFSSGLEAMYEKMEKDGAEMVAEGKKKNAESSGTGDELIKKGNDKREKAAGGLESMRSFKKLSDVVNGSVEAFNALEGALNPLIDLASALGNTGLKDGVGIASGAVSSAQNTLNAFGTLSQTAAGLGMGGVSKALGSAGAYGAAASMALSVASSLLGGKSASMKAWEEANRHLENLESVTKDINQNLESDISSASGSQSISAARSLYENNQELLEANRDTYYTWTNAKTHAWGHRNRVKTNLDYDMLNEWLEQIGWDGKDYNGNYMPQSIELHYNDDGSVSVESRTYVGSQEIQNLDPDILKEFRDTHAAAWADMNEQAREYLDSIIEIGSAEGELDQVAETLMKALAGFDTSEIADSWSSLLSNLSSETDDFADDLEKKIRQAILSGMVANLYSPRIEELKNLINDLGTNDEYVDKNGNIRKHVNRDANGNLTYDEADIASEYTQKEYRLIEQMGNEIADGMTGERDMLEKLYGWSDSDSSSMSSSVQGITEQTADIGVSYLNAIRADGSVRRQLQGLYLPKLDVTATAQLQQLGMITENTRRNAEAAERMEKALYNINDILERARAGTSQLSVKVV